jgi:3-isopropylmalate/(R)-2-methylmalate dehydratase small subunit
VEKFVVHRGTAAPLLRANIDTDAIIPSREIRQVSKVGLADGLFAGWRYLDERARTPDPAFVLNQPSFAHASILLAGPNFGCGSSREHAVWALREFGIRTIIAPSFGVIFEGNCIRNGLLPVVLEQDTVEQLASETAAGPLTVDLLNCVVRSPSGTEHCFRIGAQQREMLLEGLDPVALTLRLNDRICAFRERDRRERPWIYLLPHAAPPARR